MPNDAERFLEWLLTAGEGACHFLFTMRALHKSELDEPFSFLSERGCVVRLVPDVSYIKHIIRSYVDSIRSDHPSSVYLNPSDKELEQFIEQKVGTDLDRLVRYLSEAWDPDQEPLRNASEVKILVNVWNRFGLDNPGRRDLLCRLSSLGQFDINVYTGFLEDLAYDEVQGLLRDGLVYRLRGGKPIADFTGLTEPKDCEYILESFAHYRAVDIGDYTAEQITEYVKARPPNITMTLYALEREGKTEFIKAICKDNEAFVVLQDSQKGAPISRLRKVMQLLSKEIDLRKLFLPWSSSDYRKTINSAGLNAIRILFYTLEKWNLPDIASRFAEQISSADLKRLLAPSVLESLVDLNRLIGNLRFIPEELSLFLQKLSLMDLGVSISNAKATDVRWLIWQMLLFDPPSASNFVMNNVESLTQLILSTEWPETYWLFWNIHQSNTELSCRLIENEEINRKFLNRLSSVETVTMNLALLALLHFCGKEIANIPLPSSKLDELVEAINGESHLNLRVLSLKTLMVRLPAQELMAVKGRINLEDIKAELRIFTVAQTKKFLEEIVKEF